MVITGLTRNQVDGNVSWVRIPPPPPKKAHREVCFFASEGFERAEAAAEGRGRRKPRRESAKHGANPTSSAKNSEGFLFLRCF